MKFLRRTLFAAALGTLLTSAAFAQTTGTGGTGTGTGGTGTGTGGGGLGGTSAGSQSLTTTPTISGTADTRTNAQGVNTANPFAGYYASPLYQGRAGASPGEAPGGFGAPLYGTATGTTGGMGRVPTGGAATTRAAGTSGTGRTSNTGFGGTTGTTGFGATSTGFGGTTGTGFGGTTGTGFGAAGRTGATGFGGATGGFGGATGGFGGAAGGFGGTTGGFGGTGRAGGLGGRVTGVGGFGATGQTGGLVAAAPRAISYTATVRFATAPVPQAEFQTNVRDVVVRSSMLSNPAGVQVATEGRVVVLTGAVKDEDEARLVEGMVRLTPGVQDVRNELTYPVTPATP